MFVVGSRVYGNFVFEMPAFPDRPTSGEAEPAGDFRARVVDRPVPADRTDAADSLVNRRAALAPAMPLPKASVPMSVQPSLDKIINLAESVSRSLGLVLVEARLSKPGRRRTLEITVHHPERPVSLSDCEALSRKLEVLLDEQSPPLVEGAYTLDVQSPGIDRILKTDREFEIFRGYLVEVKSKDKLEGLGYSFTGTLLEKSSDTVTFAKPRPLLRVASRATRKKREPVPTQVDEISLALARLVHVRLYPEDLYSRRADSATVL